MIDLKIPASAEDLLTEAYDVIEIYHRSKSSQVSPGDKRSDIENADFSPAACGLAATLLCVDPAELLAFSKQLRTSISILTFERVVEAEKRRDGLANDFMNELLRSMPAAGKA